MTVADLDLFFPLPCSSTQLPTSTQFPSFRVLSLHSRLSWTAATLDLSGSLSEWRRSAIWRRPYHGHLPPPGRPPIRRRRRRRTGPLPVTPSVPPPAARHSQPPHNTVTHRHRMRWPGQPHGQWSWTRRLPYIERERNIICRYQCVQKVSSISL